MLEAIKPIDRPIAFHEDLRMLREGRFREALLRVGLGWGDDQRSVVDDRAFQLGKISFMMRACTV
jgi:hypothetical protein